MTECEQREDPAFAPVVGAGDVTDVFDAHDQHQRPEHQRQNAKHPGSAFGRGELRQALLHGVERTGADVSEDDAQGAQGQAKPGLAGKGRGVFWLAHAGG